MSTSQDVKKIVQEADGLSGKILVIDDDAELCNLLSTEEREKLSASRPPTLAAGSRIPGVTPNALLARYFAGRELFAMPLRAVTSLQIPSRSAL